jgi:hypothetical protein
MLSKAMNEFVVQEMDFVRFLCQDDFVERVMDDKAFIPVPLLPSKAFRNLKKKREFVSHS